MQVIAWFILALVCFAVIDAKWTTKMEKLACKKKGYLEDYKCRSFVCVPNDYEKSSSSDHMIFANIVLVDENKSIGFNAIESIDVTTFKINYFPKFVLMWTDPRVRFCKSFKHQELDESLISDKWKRRMIWSPKIDIKDTEKATEHDKSLISTTIFKMRHWNDP